MKPADVKQKAEASQKRREAKSSQNRPTTKAAENYKATSTNLTKPKVFEKEAKILTEKLNQDVGDDEPSVETARKDKDVLINQTASQNEELDLLEGLEEDSSFEQEITQATTARFHRIKKSKSKTKKNNIEAIYKNLHLACVYKTSLESNVLSKDLNVVLGCLKNWELISEKKSKMACKALKLIAQSSANFLLVEAKSIEILAKLLRSSNVGLDIKLSIVSEIF